MHKQRAFGLILAATFALTGLAGCQAPGQTSSPTMGQPGTAEQANAKEGTSAALAEEREMDDYDFAAGQESTSAGYAVMAAGQPKPRDGQASITGGAEVEAGARTERREQAAAAFMGKLPDNVRQQLVERQAQKAERAKARLEKMKGARAKIAEKVKGTAWVDNGDGTESKRFDFAVAKSVEGKAANRTVEMSRTRHSETKDLVSSTVVFSMTLPNGMTRSSERTKTLNADGSYTVVFHSEHTFKDGRKRVADWTKTIALDGAVNGTGTIVWTDKDGNEAKKTDVTLGGSDTEPKAVAEGEQVTPDEAAPEAEAGVEAAATSEATVEGDEAAATTEATVEADADASA